MIARLTTAEILWGAFYAAVLVAAAVASGVGLARRVAGADPLDYALVAVLGVIAEPVAVGLALGAVGLLDVVPVVVVSAAVGVAAVFRAPPRERAEPSARPSPWLAVVMGLGCALAATSLVVGFRAGLSDHFETNNYHYSAVAHFVQEGSIWSLPYQNPALFTATAPSSVEVLAAEATFATGGDQLLYGWLFPLSALLAVLAAAALAREIGGRATSGALAALAVLASPFVFFGTRSLANDVLPVAGVLAATALVLRGRRERDRAPMVLAGIALGLAIGTKYTAVVPGALLVGGTALLIRPWHRSLLTAPGVVALAGPWLVRNLIEADNPLYPQAVRFGGVEIFEGYKGPLEFLNPTIGGHLLHLRTEPLEMWFDLARPVFGPLLIAAPLGGLVGVVVATRRRNIPLGMTAALAFLCLVVYAATPSTGGEHFAAMGSNLRYAILAVMLGVVVLSSSLRGHLDRVVGLALLGWSAWKLVDQPRRPDLELGVRVTVGAALVGLVVAAAVWTGRLRPPRVARSAWAAPTVAGLLSLVCVGSILAGPRRVLDTNALETAVQRAAATIEPAAPSDTVAGIGVSDVRAVAGGDLARRLERVIDLRGRSSVSAGMVDAALNRVASAILVVRDTPGIPRGYVPPADWCRFTALRDGTEVYVRAAVARCP